MLVLALMIIYKNGLFTSSRLTTIVNVYQMLITSFDFGFAFYLALKSHLFTYDYKVTPNLVWTML